MVRTSSATTNTKPKNNLTINIPAPKVVIFFVGGAGDKRPFAFSGPNRNIVYAYNDYKKLRDITLSKHQRKLIIDNEATSYLGYYEIYGDDNIKSFVLDKIPNKNTSIYIIGHSLGGWNGAHLTDKLSKKGYKTNMLITLDPVGEGLFIKFADIYNEAPKVISNTWINIRCNPEDYGFSDIVADLGNQWDPNEDEPTYNVITSANHLDADDIISTKVFNNYSALELLIKSIQGSLI